MKTLRIITAGLIAVCLSMVAVVASAQKGNGNNDRDRDNRLSASARRHQRGAIGVDGRTRTLQGDDLGG